MKARVTKKETDWENTLKLYHIFCLFVNDFNDVFYIQNMNWPWTLTHVQREITLEFESDLIFDQYQFVKSRLLIN